MSVGQEVLPQPRPPRDRCPPPRYRRCSDDAGGSEDRGDAERLGHLPAAGQRGADALVVVARLWRLFLEELDGFPAGGRQRGGEQGGADPPEMLHQGPGEGGVRGGLTFPRAKLPVAPQVVSGEV